MLKKLKARLKKANNRGSSFVLVIVSTSFLCILISSLLMGMLLAYKLKYYRLNSLNNFYSVEKAMDEIYAGIGASTNEHLYSAYTTTAELVVYYKTDSETGTSGYTYLSDDEANDLFRQLFIQGFADDASYSAASFLSTIEGFISDSSVKLSYDNLVIDYMSYDEATNKEGHKYVKYLADGSYQESADIGYSENDLTQITFKNVCVTRDITVNSNTKDENYSKTASGNYVQSITTDIVLTEPEFNVSFDITASNSDSLYSYAILADMGLEVSSADETNVSITGNIYTATDYYNKDYNGAESTKVTNLYTDDPKFTWGRTNDSLYSGIYVNGDKTSLTLMSDVIVCSGTLAAFNGASITLGGATSNLAELWTDNIVIGGTEDGSITMAADAYVFDDTELNAEGSSLSLMSGRYFGYSYSSEDLRSIDYLGGVKNSVNTTQANNYLTTNFSLKSHFGDSAIIVNGEDSVLDLSNASSIYIAGKSYIEFSRLAADSLSDVSDEDLVAMGLSSSDIKADYSYTTLLDYSTGLSLDVKSNQLMFLANWAVVEGSELTADEAEELGLPSGYTYLQVQFPYTSDTYGATLNNTLQDLYADLNTLNTKNALYAIKQVVSGHTYYYLYIDDSAIDENDTDTRGAAERFVEKYYDFVETYGETIESIYNVVNYESFTVSTISLPSDNSLISANAAVTKTNSDNSLYVTASTDTTLNVGTALKSASTSKVFTTLLGGLSTTSDTETNTVYEKLLINSSKLVNGNEIGSSDAKGNNITSSQISDFLNYMYTNLKDHLSVANRTDDSGNETSAYSLAGYTESDGSYYYTTGTDGTISCNYSITPLTYFINFERIFKEDISINEPITYNSSGSQATVIVSSGSVNVTSNMSGIIICGGNVTFSSVVTSFTGLIICGGKIYCDHSMTIKSSENMVVGILDNCAENDVLNVLTTDSSDSKTRLIRNYVSSSSDDSTEVSGLSISDISYYDILSFQNWKKNVE